MLDDAEIQAWKEAAEDLGIEIEIRSDVILVRDFGSKQGMLCANRMGVAHVEQLREQAEAQGMGWSALGPSYAHYERQPFVDMLNDWGWTGEGDPPPWYTGSTE